MSSSLSKILETGINVFKINYQTIKNTPFKGKLNVISNDPPCQDGNAPFTTVSLKTLSDQN